MKRLARFLLFLVLFCVLLAGFVFTLNNTTAVPLWLGTELTPRPLGIWMLLAFTVGGLAGLLLGLGLWQRLHNKKDVRQLRLRLQQKEQELAMVKHHSTLPPQGRDTGSG